MNTVLKNKAALRRGRLGLAGGVAALLLAGCLSNGDDATQSGADSRTNPSENAGLKYDVSITRTTFGVPHIRAKITAVWVTGKDMLLRKTTCVCFSRTC